MGTLHLERPTSDAVIFNLRAAGLLVGDGDPDDAWGWQGTPGASTFKGYVNMYPLGGSTIANPDEIAMVRYQLSSVGANRRQAEQIADLVRVVMLTWPLTVPGRSVTLVRLEPAGAFREDEGSPPLWSVPDRYRVHTEPA